MHVPPVCGLDKSVAAAETVADDEVTVNILRVRKARQRSELLDVACAGAAVENFDAVPSCLRLPERCEDCLFNRVEPVVT